MQWQDPYRLLWHAMTRPSQAAMTCNDKTRTGYYDMQWQDTYWLLYMTCNDKTRTGYYDIVIKSLYFLQVIYHHMSNIAVNFIPMKLEWSYDIVTVRYRTVLIFPSKIFYLLSSRTIHFHYPSKLLINRWITSNNVNYSNYFYMLIKNTII